MHVPSTEGPVYDHRCTANERALLDDIAKQTDDVAATFDADVQAIYDIVAAQKAVIDAAIADHQAQQAAIRLGALTAPTGSLAVEQSDAARITARQARATLTAAVEHLITTTEGKR